MSNFEEAAKSLRKFACNFELADLDFFNKSKYPKFSVYQNKFNDNLEKIEKEMNSKSPSKIYLNSLDDLELIYIGKKKYSENNLYDSIFQSQLEIIKDFINKSNMAEQCLEHIDLANEEVEKLKKALLSLDKNNGLKKTNKRVDSVNTQIKEKRKEISNMKKEIKNIMKDISQVKEAFQSIEKIFDNLERDSKEEYKRNIAMRSVNQENNNSELNDIKSFLINKTDKEDVMFKIQMSKGQRFEEVTIFNDSSIAYRKDGAYKTIPISSIEYRKTTQEICEDYIKFLLRKKPNYINPFIDKMKKEQYNLSQSVIAIKSLIQYEQILKNYDFNVLEVLKTKRLEYFDDEINKIKQKHDINMLASSIISSKYKHLYNDKVFSQIKELYELKVTKSELQDNIGKKIAGFKKPKDLIEALQKYINTLQEFDMESTLSKSSRFNVDISVKKEEYLILKINDFEASKAIGSGSWCISRHESHFNSYVGDENYQFFVFDFSKDSKDSSSMIGITLHKNGEYSASHLKNDDPYYESDKGFNKYHMEIILNNRDLFNLTDELKKKLENYTKTENKVKIKNAI